MSGSPGGEISEQPSLLLAAGAPRVKDEPRALLAAPCSPPRLLLPHPHGSTFCSGHQGSETCSRAATRLAGAAGAARTAAGSGPAGSKELRRAAGGKHRSRSPTPTPLTGMLCRGRGKPTAGHHTEHRHQERGALRQSSKVGFSALAPQFRVAKGRASFPPPCRGQEAALGPRLRTALRAAARRVRTTGLRTRFAPANFLP